MIKCLVWDLDNTLLDGVYLESGDQPPAANPAMAAVAADLSARGILQAVASRNPPEAARHAEHVTGQAFAAVRCGWGAKSAALTEIMTELDMPADAIAFVDDDALERAEVSFTLPGILVLAPEDMADAAGWPQFSPPVITDEARRRGELYLRRRVRQEEARAFSGSRDEFLRYCQTEVTIAPAGAGDLARIHELSVRTHQFNSMGNELTEQELAGLLTSAGQRVVTVRLADRFGDDGLVGAAVIAVDGAGAERRWQTELLMMSCRAMGRGVAEALLAWICRAARSDGAWQVRLPCLINPRNVPLRIALAGSGFRAREEAAAGPGQDRIAVYVRGLDGPLPELPDWVNQPEAAP